MRGSSALLPGQSRGAPAADAAALLLRVQWAFEALKDVPGRSITGLGRRLGGARGAGAAAAEEQDLAIKRYGLRQLFEEFLVADLLSPLRPFDVDSTGHAAHPVQFLRGPHVDQRRLA